MVTITFTLSDANAQRLITATNALHPQDTPEGQEPLTPAQAAKEYWRKAMVRDVLAYERQQAQAAVTEDNNLVS